MAPVIPVMPMAAAAREGYPPISPAIIEPIAVVVDFGRRDAKISAGIPKEYQGETTARWQDSRRGTEKQHRRKFSSEPKCL
jgi:hypothetical protein